MVQIGQSTHSMGALQFISPPHVLILEARFYDEVNDHLLRVRLRLWIKPTQHGKTDCSRIFEIPIALQYAAQRKVTASLVLFCCVGLRHSWRNHSLRNCFQRKCKRGHEGLSQT